MIIREVGFLHPSGVDTLLTLLDAIVLSQNAEENRFRSALGGGRIGVPIQISIKQVSLLATSMRDSDYCRFVCSLTLIFRAMKRHSSESFKL